MGTNTWQSRRGAGRRSTEQFPETLEGFGYQFNERGQLRRIDNPEMGFAFEVKPGDKEYNQKHYEALGEIITEEIYKRLEMDTGLKRFYVPVTADGREARGFFFASDNAWTSDHLLVLIHGSGVVRAGQWSRKLIINDDIDTGSQIPYIKDALEWGFGVIVLNTNLNRAQNADGEDVLIRENEDPLSHAIYVWDNFIKGASARFIAMVAHSAGGYVTVNLAHERSEEFKNRVFAVAFTDSSHSVKPSSPCWDHLLQVSRNWVTSRLELGKKEKSRLDDVDRVSAGTLSHEMTSSSAISDIRNYIRQRCEAVGGSIVKPEDTLPDQVVTDQQDTTGQQPIQSLDAEREATPPKVDHDTSNGLVEEPPVQKTEL